MGIRLYDEALLAKIKSWVRDDKIKILSPSDIQQRIEILADETNDSPIQLPFIALERNSEVSILDYGKNKTQKSYNGWKLKIQEDNGTTTLKTLDVIPILLSYQLEIFTRYFEEADEYTRSFLFNLINYPKLEIHVPYNDTDFIHSAYIRLKGTFLDSSDVPVRLIQGQFSRWTLAFTIEDAYLFKVPTRKEAKIIIPEFDVDVNDGEEIKFYTDKIET